MNINEPPDHRGVHPGCCCMCGAGSPHIQQPGGVLLARDRGTPQGSAVSPVLANLFMHYAFDQWLTREHPDVVFERYADDAVVHCVSETRAHQVLAGIADRMGKLGLTLHPAKTQIVYCKDRNRPLRYERTAFTFLGYTFRPRAARDRQGVTFLAFLPAISKQALKKISLQVRRWRLHRRIYHPSANLPARSIRSSRAGCSTTGGSTRRRCIPSWRASTPT